ncbi:nucleotidyltransferase family protein [Gracilimonas sediminicola]|uniref:Nucleotidyltransferase family protein n=1 Tax=Gracilimonas sediminicola TaxID=2952158 RepID=A0A9X2RDJ9_9BACT|nr:nucleotidyltransferase family protein [Gracilimonas sediminicola]MCP9291310.1 nucleotidyltransferase family protein [Gracilimonas sediminicola]
MITKEQENIIIEKTRPFKPERIGIFGSYARNEQTKESDLDILVNFRERINLLDIVGLEQELSDLLGMKVDLITEKSVDKKLRSYIRKDLKLILDD